MASSSAAGVIQFLEPTTTGAVVAVLANLYGKPIPSGRISYALCKISIERMFPL
jgi:hypothetical protein